MVAYDFSLALNRVTVKFAHNAFNCYVHILILCGYTLFRTFSMYCGSYLTTISYHVQYHMAPVLPD